MKYKVNDCSVFFPQRILSAQDKQISGVYLNESEVCNITVENGFDQILQSQSDGMLASNNQDNPLLIVFVHAQGKSQVINDRSKKILFCQSYLHDGHVHILKIAKKREFSADEGDSLSQFVTSNVGKNDKATENVEVDIDGKISHVGYGDKFNPNAFLHATATPYVRLPSKTLIGSSKRGYSMVVLDISEKLLCLERHDVSSDMAILTEGQDELMQKKVGLDAYYQKLKLSK